MGSLGPRKPRNIPLETGWHLKDASKSQDNWIPVQKVPSVVHTELIRQGRISDPYVGLNELDVEWVGERSWVYKVAFNTPEVAHGEEVDLVVEGLDTFAEVVLNQKCILKSANMFIGHRVNINDRLLCDGTNQLEIVFSSALEQGRCLEKEHSKHRFIAHNGETGRLAVRKAQYHWGWDWGPVLMTAGPWKPVRLEIYQSRITDVWTTYELSDNLHVLQGTVHSQIQGHADVVRFRLFLDNETLFETEAAPSADGQVKVDITLDNPRLWYPIGYGSQPLYTLIVEILVNHNVRYTTTKKVGFRQLELVQEDDVFGTSFYFRVNHVDVFCGGSCWIPADNFLSEVSETSYRKWLNLLVRGNQNMIRVWGGGVYEQDVFYDLCDEMGILVWQDFMFACGSYPTWPGLLQTIEDEAVYNCRRLRHHPSIALLCGSNEDYQIQEWYGLDYQQTDDPQEWLKSTFPARYIYEYLLPKVVAAEVPGTRYWPCSPYTGGGKNSGDLTIGDIHMWDVWHNKQEKYQKYCELGGRFNSEFGLASLPCLETIKSFVTDQSEMHGQSVTMDFHNKADGQERRIATYVLENFRQTSDFETWIYLTQLAQSEAMIYAYKDWRRQWREPRLRQCGGALAWQLNDCWPCSSWSIVDYYHRPKPAYYAIKRILNPIAIGVRREHHDWSNSHLRPQPLQYWLWVMNSGHTSIKAKVELRFVSIQTGRDTESTITRDVELIGNGVTEILEGQLEDKRQHAVVLAARVWVGGQCVSRDADWPQPFKYTRFPERGLSLSVHETHLVLSTEKPVKGFVIEEKDGVQLSDNGLDLMPGDPQSIKMEGFSGGMDQIKWRFLE